MTARIILLRLLFAIVLLFLLLAVFHAIENWRGERAWQDYVSAARARGAKLYVPEFQAPPISPEQNYLAIPLFEEAFAAAETGGRPPEPLALPKKGTAPAKGDAAKGEGTNMGAWRDYFLKAGLLEAAGDDSAADVLRALEKYEPVLQQLRDAAERPASRLPVKWERGFEAPAPHSGLINQIARLLSLRISAHLAQGNSAAAYAEFQHGLRLHKGLQQEPTMISGLLRLMVLSNLLQSVWEGLAEQQWTDAELRGLSADLSTLRIVDDLRFSWDSERSSLNTQLDIFAKMSPAKLMETIAGISGGMSPRQMQGTTLLLAVGYPRGWFRQNQVLMNDMYDVALKRFDQIEKGGVASAPKDGRIESIDRGFFPLRWYYMLTRIIMPVMSYAEGRFFASEARIQQAITACALERYRLAHGSYPAKLDELVPEYLDKVPRDLLANHPMKYRQTPEGRYEIWAVGENGVDDDAKLDFRKSSYKQPDWVWHYRKPPEPKPRKIAQP